MSSILMYLVSNESYFLILYILKISDENKKRKYVKTGTFKSVMEKK